MKEHDNAPLETVVCGRCARLCDPDDNFCRQCGLTLTDSKQHLPAVRHDSLPAVWKPRVRGAVVKGAVFVAAGTLAEAFLRRLVRRRFGSEAERTAVARNDKHGVVDGNGAAGDDPEFLSDTVLLRHIRIRR